MSTYSTIRSCSELEAVLRGLLKSLAARIVLFDPINISVQEVEAILQPLMSDYIYIRISHIMA